MVVERQKGQRLRLDRKVGTSCGLRIAGNGQLSTPSIVIHYRTASLDAASWKHGHTASLASVIFSHYVDFVLKSRCVLLYHNG